MKTTSLDPAVFHECHLKLIMDDLKAGKITRAVITYTDEINIGEKLFSVETT